MRTRHAHILPTVLGALLLAAGPVANAAGARGLLDHSLCCGGGAPGLGVDGTADHGTDPVLRRHRMPPPPKAASGPILPGADGFVSETPASGATPTDAAPEQPLRIPTELVEGHLDLGFETLGGYPFKLTKEQAAAIGAGDRAATDVMLAQIPEAIQKLDGKKVLMTGFMLPMKLEGGLASEFLLIANSMLCCYGVVPPMNQWAVVKMKKGGLKPLQDVPIQIFGTLRVQPQTENGVLSTIYSLEAERLRTAKK